MMLTFFEAMLKKGGNLKRDSTAVISSWLLLDMEGVLHMKASHNVAGAGWYVH